MKPFLFYFFGFSHSQKNELNYEVNRASTFAGYDTSPLCYKILARTGMYIFQPPTGAIQLTCYFCQITFGKWSVIDDEVMFHRSASPHCPLLRNYTTNNVPINQFLLDEEIQPIQPQTKMVKMYTWPIGSEDTEVKREMWRSYILMFDRKYSFRAAPTRYKRVTDAMATAGFFYKGSGRVQCFCCLLVIQNWNDKCDIQFIHAMLSPTCSVVLAQCSSDNLFSSGTRSDTTDILFSIANTDNSVKQSTEFCSYIKQSTNSTNELFTDRFFT